MRITVAQSLWSSLRLALLVAVGDFRVFCICWLSSDYPHLSVHKLQSRVSPLGLQFWGYDPSMAVPVHHRSLSFNQPLVNTRDWRLAQS